MTTTYRTGAGRLAVDRYDFQHHIDGYSLNHPAAAIALESPLTIYTSEITFVEATNVQQAIVALSEVIIPQSIPDASSVNRGVIKLLGDLGGTALSPTVTRIQGKLVNTVVPSDGDVLTWSSGGSTWGPAAPTTFVASGDLSGTATTQAVTNISGAGGGTVTISAEIVEFDLNSSAIIQQQNTINDGTNLTITGQSSTGTNKNGGNVIISGGSGNGSAKTGGVSLFMTSGTVSMLEAKEVSIGRRVLGLLNSTALSSSDMPSGTGDMVIFVKNAVTAPTSGNPVGGAIMYSSNGQMYVKESSGATFVVGSTPNPSIWGTFGQLTYKYRVLVTSTTSTAITALTYAVPDNSSIRVNAAFVGKKTGSADASQYDVVMGCLRSAAGAPVAIGSVVVNDTRVVGASTPWGAAPTIVVSGNNILVKTGYNAATTINWYVDITIIVCGD